MPADDDDERYTIEPPPERQRELTRDGKLDRIIDLLTSGQGESTGGGDAPEVTFEPEVDQLPETPDNQEPGEGEHDDPAGQGEGTANVSDQNKKGGYRHPSARRHAVLTRD